MRTTAKTRRKGLLVPADDLAVGRWYCVHGVGGDPSQPVTFDVSRLDLMPVTQEYAEAQRPRTCRVA